MASFRYSWTSREIEDAENASLLVAADVIYSDDLTDAFFSTLERLMSRGSTKVYINSVLWPYCDSHMLYGCPFLEFERSHILMVFSF